MSGASVLNTLQELIAINSVNPAYTRGVGEQRIQEYIQAFFASRDIRAVLMPVYPERPNLIATLPGRDRSRRLILEAHVDTAGVDNVVGDPFRPEIRGGRIYGRGACDTKGGLAAMMHALAELKDEDFVPACDVVLAAAMDEEHSYRGVVHVCEAMTADAAIVAEPTDLKLVVASKGCLRWRMTVEGRAAHSAKPELGVNAISRMARLIAAMEDKTSAIRNLDHPLLGRPTLNVGIIQGGTQINIVPEQCSIELDRRLVPGESPQDVLLSYQASVAGMLDGAKILHTPLLEDWPMETPTDSHIVRTTLSALESLSLPASPTGVPFGSDASKFSRAGIPSIVLGPGSIDQAHTHEEYVSADQVTEAVEVYKRVIQLFLSEGK